MRLFAAVKIADAMRDALGDCINEMKKIPYAPQKAKWVPKENIHLTLKFFGEVEENRLQTLFDSLSVSVEKQKRFSFMIQSVGGFPQMSRPRVLWAGVHDPLGPLKQMAESVENETVQSGFFSADKPFSAHLTIARFPAVPRAVFLEHLKKYETSQFGENSVDKMVLVRSRLEPGGPVYQDIREFPLHDS